VHICFDLGRHRDQWQPVLWLLPINFQLGVGPPGCTACSGSSDLLSKGLTKFNLNDLEQRLWLVLANSHVVGARIIDAIGTMDGVRTAP
jgi:hypothetical protein